MSSKQTAKRYFASANGYDGFKSYFDEIFNPYEFEKTFIIKGGPGTGKSSLMKAISNHFIEKGAGYELIFCSSDPESLDGVILESKSRVAIIDGTAPHLRDPALPGALDTIINLESNLNPTLLQNNRNKIVNLSVSKTKRYSDAYEYLKICSGIEKAVTKEITECYTGVDDGIIFDLLSNDKRIGKRTKRLITSYGKNGFGYLDTLEKIGKAIYNVVGLYGSDYVFMNHLYNKVTEKGVEAIVCPSPLSSSSIDAIYLKESGVAIIVGRRTRENSGTVIDTSLYIDNKKTSERRDKMEFLWKEREIFLWNSADEFKKAYDIHKELESVYSSAMDFSKNSDCADKIITEIEKILF